MGVDCSWLLPVHRSSHEVYPEFRIEPVEPGWRTYEVCFAPRRLLDRYQKAKKEWGDVQELLRDAKTIFVEGYDNIGKLLEQP